MSDPEAQSTQNLLPGSDQRTAPAQSGRSTRAYVVAGLTLVACVLIASQAMIVYFLVHQKGDIKALSEQSSTLKEQLAKGRSSGSMQIPMRAAAAFNTLTFDEGSSTDAPTATKCQEEAEGIGGREPVIPGYYPVCDELGLYKAQQCYMGRCWCVDPINGVFIHGSERNGRADCNKGKDAGRMNMMMLPDVSV